MSQGMKALSDTFAQMNLIISSIYQFYDNHTISNNVLVCLKRIVHRIDNCYSELEMRHKKVLASNKKGTNTPTEKTAAKNIAIDKTAIDKIVTENIPAKKTSAKEKMTLKQEKTTVQKTHPAEHEKLIPEPKKYTSEQKAHTLTQEVDTMKEKKQEKVEKTEKSKQNVLTLQNKLTLQIKKQKTMIIAIDFDGTIVEHKYPEIGREIPFAIETLKRLQADRHKLILWSVREGRLLDEAVEFCRQRGLEFYAVNRDYPEEEKDKNSHFSRKLKADLFIDDRNLGGLPDWGTIYNMVKNRLSYEDLMSQYEDEAEDTKANNKGFLKRLFGK